MSIYGSLFSAVSGIQAQGVAIGIISDNISNINTVGYKASSQQFGTLVTNANTSSSYSPGGVRAQSRQLVSQQGLVQTTSSALDIAIQGNGQFVVTDGLDEGASVLFSRAGNFSTDSQGNFLNAAGYFLQAWPLDGDGNIPTNSTSTGTLETVNIGEAFGEAAATTRVEYQGNLDATSDTLSGSGQVSQPGADGVNVENQGVTGTSIIVPNGNLGLNDGTVSGAAAELAAELAAQTDGDASIAAGGNIATAAAAAIAAGAAVAEVTAIAGATATVTAAGNAAIVASAATATAAGAAANTAAGNAAQVAGDADVLAGGTNTTAANAARDAAILAPEVAAISGAAAAIITAADAARDASILAGDTPAQTVTAVVAASRTAADTAVAAGTTVAAVVAAMGDSADVTVRAGTSDYDGDSLRITTNTNFSDDFVYGGFTESSNIGGGLLGASTSTQPFNGAGLVATGDEFSIVVNNDTANPKTFTYVPSAPVASNGEFNSLQTLAEAINSSSGINARIAEVNGGEVRLYVSASDARQQVAFSSASGATADFPTALGLTDIPATSANRWNTMEGLAELANNETQGRLKAEVTGSSSTNARLNLFNADPLSTIQFSNVDSDTDSAAIGDFLAEFDISGTEQLASYNAVAGSDALSISSGNIEADFTRTFSVFDSLGQEHELNIGFVKVGVNSWRAELYASDPDDIETTVVGGDPQDRFIASTGITFDGSGNLDALSADWLDADNAPLVRWTSGADPSTILVDLGTVGTKTGIAQSGGLETSNVTQNGAAVGLLSSVSIDEEGFVVANFNNGQSKKLYKIPIATFSNYDGLQSRNGNVFIQTLASGDVNLAEAGDSGAGTITPQALETSNAELSEELTDMIVAQRAYQASAKVITTADELLEELNRIT